MRFPVEAIPLRSNSLPYERCINKLRQLEEVRTPISKLKVIVGCADKITRCINEFNRLNGIPLKQSMIDADQVLSIFTYILCQSRVRNVEAHLQIIENFSNEEQLLSITGYYYSVLLCAVENLINKEDSQKRMDLESRRSLDNSTRIMNTEAFDQA